MIDAEGSRPGITGPSRRVVVSGVGAVSTWGWGTPVLWAGLEGDATGVGEPARFDTEGHRTRVAAEVDDPPAALSTLPGWDHLTRADRFGVAAAREACRQAGWSPDIGLTGVYWSGSTAGMVEAEGYFRHLLDAEHDDERPRERPSLRDLASQPINSPGDAVARHLGCRGAVETVSSACAAGGLAIGAALDALRRGDVDVAIAGGSDALCQLTYSGFNSLRAVDPRPCRPFRAEREGLSLGEGAGVLVLEPLERALARGVRPLAELLGVGASCDAHHMTAPHPEGRGAALALRRALDDAHVAPAAVGFVNAHGTGTPHNDAAEWKALRSVFDDAAADVPLTSTKGSVGHLLGSSGAIEAVATVLCLAHGRAHPTPGGGAADPELDVDLVLGESRPLEPGTVAVSTSLAFGGSNAAVVLAGWSGELAMAGEWAEAESDGDRLPGERAA